MILVMLMSTLGCTTETEVVDEIAEEVDHTIQIGMCFDSFIIERWERDRDAFVSKCSDELGVEVNVQSANGNVSLQSDQIDYLIGQEVDVIVVIAVESEGIAEAVKRAKEAGIRVIAYDRMVYNADVDLYITFDNTQVGVLMGEAIVNEVGTEAEILMISGPLEDNNVMLVNDGFFSVINETNCTIVGLEYATGWIAEYGFDYVNEYIDNGIEFDVVMCGNDDIASQVFKALSENRLAGEVVVVGQDAELGACQRIVEGTQTMTVYKPIEEMAQIAAEYAVQLANHEDIHVEDTIYDGMYEVPYVGLEPTALTLANIDVVIDAGYHMQEDVYLYVD